MKYALVLLALLGGCASAPLASKAADAEAKEFAPVPGKAKIYVYRKTGVLGSAFAFQVAVDGRVLGNLSRATYAVYVGPPGLHMVSSTSPEDSSLVEMTTVGGMIYFVEQYPQWGWFRARTEVRIIAEPDKGREAVRKCRLIQPFGQPVGEEQP